MQLQQLIRLINASNAANAKGEFNAALNMCQEALAINPGQPETWFNMGIAQRGLGRHIEASSSLEQARLRTLTSPEAQNSIALEFMALGAYESAEKCLKRALDLSPDYVYPLSNLGRLRLQQGRIDDAEQIFRKALGREPKLAGLHVNMSSALLQKHRYQDAARHCQQAIDLDANLPQAWSNLGIALEHLQQQTAAEKAYRKALKIAPDLSEVWTNLGNLLSKQKRYGAAETACNKAIELTPNATDAWLGLANVYLKNEPADPVRALQHIDHALAIEPNNATAWRHRAAALSKMNQHEEARHCLDKSISLNRNSAETHYDKGVLLTKLGEDMAALQSYQEAITIYPEFADAQLNKSLLLLSLGNYADGWVDYEYRWESEDLDLKRVITNRPRWKGNPSNQPLLLWGEQGIGDQLLFASILPELAALPQSKLVALDKRLVPLFARSMHSYKFDDIENVNDTTEFSEHLPLGTLPLYFRTSLASFSSAQHPFIFADPTRVNILREKIARRGKIVCGVSWASTRKVMGQQKTIDLMQLLEPLVCEHLHFVNLQYGDTATEREMLQREMGVTVQNLEEIDNFIDLDGLAALIQACDIVISTSNTTAHLAGALGKETLLLLPSASARLWYWTEYGGKNPWYPSIRSFEQIEAGQWKHPLQQIRQHLDNKSWN